MRRLVQDELQAALKAGERARDGGEEQRSPGDDVDGILAAVGLMSGHVAKVRGELACGRRAYQGTFLAPLKFMLATAGII